MALPWVDFVWTIKKWLSLYPTDAISNLPVSVKTADYILTANDYMVVSNSGSQVTVTMLAAASHANRTFVFKNRGAGNLVLSGSSFFTTSVVSSVTLTTGATATLTSDGTYWNTV